MTGKGPGAVTSPIRFAAVFYVTSGEANLGHNLHPSPVLSSDRRGKLLEIVNVDRRFLFNFHWAGFRYFDVP